MLFKPNVYENLLSGIDIFAKNILDKLNQDDLKILAFSNKIDWNLVKESLISRWKQQKKVDLRGEFRNASLDIGKKPRASYTIKFKLMVCKLTETIGSKLVIEKLNNKGMGQIKHRTIMYRFIDTTFYKYQIKFLKWSNSQRVNIYLF